MSDIIGREPEVHMTVHITRAATGLVETHELVGYVIKEPIVHGASGGLVGMESKLNSEE